MNCYKCIYGQEAGSDFFGPSFFNNVENINSFGWNIFIVFERFRKFENDLLFIDSLYLYKFAL